MQKPLKFITIVFSLVLGRICVNKGISPTKALPPTLKYFCVAFESYRCSEALDFIGPSLIVLSERNTLEPCVSKEFSVWILSSRLLSCMVAF